MFDRTNRTLICSVVFLDIVEYSRQPVTEQIRLKERFNAVLSEALQDIAVNDRIILDTGDGAAISFLGDPEDALFVAMNLRDHCEAAEDPSQHLEIRIGLNLGPVKLVKDINGRPNLIGDGINVAQRIMSFAEPGKVMVSRSYYEVVSCLSDEYAALFEYIGARTDKHVREHEVYTVGFSEHVQNARPPKRRSFNRVGDTPGIGSFKPGKLSKGAALGGLAVFVLGGTLWLTIGRPAHANKAAAAVPIAVEASIASNKVVVAPPPSLPAAAKPDTKPLAPIAISPVPIQTPDAFLAPNTTGTVSAEKKTTQEPPASPASSLVSNLVSPAIADTSYPADSVAPTKTTTDASSPTAKHIPNKPSKAVKHVVAPVATAPSTVPTPASPETPKPKPVEPARCAPSECWAGERR